VNNITKVALREMILRDNASFPDRSAALDELIAGSVVNVVTNPFDIAEFHGLRLRVGRIATIKAVRERFACGLLEALILVKGIESHYGIDA